jgi:hypothetical protein
MCFYISESVIYSNYYYHYYYYYNYYYYYYYFRIESCLYYHYHPENDFSLLSMADQSAWIYKMKQHLIYEKLSNQNHDVIVGEIYDDTKRALIKLANFVCIEEIPYFQTLKNQLTSLSSSSSSSSKRKKRKRNRDVQVQQQSSTSSTSILDFTIIDLKLRSHRDSIFLGRILLSIIKVKRNMI